MEEIKKSNNTMVMLAVAVVAAVAIGGLVWTQSQKKEEKANGIKLEMRAPTAPVGKDDKIQAQQTAARDGKYTAEGKYQSPAGAETVSVTLTIEGGLVKDAEFKGNATAPASVRYQQIFAENYKQQVIGKPIAQLKLDKVAGSSLTPKGFNDAVQKIIQLARM